MEKNIYEIFDLTPIDDPMSSESLNKIKSAFADACMYSDSSKFLNLLNALNILLDPKKRKAYDETIPELAQWKQELQNQRKKEILKQKIKEIVLKKIKDKLPSGCFIEDIDCDSPYSKPEVWITISKPTGKWVTLCIDRVALYGSAPSNYKSPEAPYFNSSGYRGCNSYGVEESDKEMPEYIKDFFGCPILLNVPNNDNFWKKRELRTISNSIKINQLEEEGISLFNGSSWGTPAKRMIVSSLDIKYSFPSKEITDKDIAEFEASLDQIEVVSNIRRVEIIVSEDDSITNDTAREYIEHFIDNYALDYHTTWSQNGSKLLHNLQMGVPVDKFEKFKKDAAKSHINFIDYGEISEDQSLAENQQINSSTRRK